MNVQVIAAPEGTILWTSGATHHHTGTQRPRPRPVMITLLARPQTPVEHHVLTETEDTFGNAPLDPFHRVPHGIQHLPAEVRMKLMEPLVSGQPKRRVLLTKSGLRTRPLAEALHPEAAPGTTRLNETQHRIFPAERSEVPCACVALVEASCDGKR